ncbi:hypothetical protein BT93_D1005 [Corymbia citriodora subsp. variegata]|nr:hypothetical protein BT93_D1005 [Corymbia citriodora subsp. variegata]
MPLPWKKSRVTRISRLVADLQSSPRRGGSLVVETGFPTSLVDLFVKNRDRLRKPSRRKPSPEPEEPELQISDPILTSPLPAHLVVGSWPVPLDDPPPEEPVAAVGSRTGDDDVGGDCVGGGGSGKNSVFLAVFKVFVVVVLALSTKGIVIGLMMSAFFLLFLEFVGKRVVRFLRPCPDARIGFEGSIGRVCVILSSVWPPRGLSVRPANTDSDPAEPSRETVGLGSSSSAVAEEIRVVESKFEMVVVPVENNSSFRPEGEWPNRDPRWCCVDTEGEVRVVEEVQEDGRAALGTDARKQNQKIKSKIIKRIVPKRLRATKKGKKKECEPIPSSSNTLAAYLGDSSIVAVLEGEAEEEYREQGENADRSCWSKAEVEECQQLVQCSNNTNKGTDQLLAAETMTLATISQACPELETGADNLRSEKKRKLRLVVVLLVVLAGLLGGRFMAFVLTFGCAITISIWARRRSFRPVKD